MAEASYMAKITRFKATLEPTDVLKKDTTTKPLVEALSKAFLGIKQKFQMEGTIIVRKLVDVEVEYYRSSVLPTVVKGLLRIAKQAVVSRRPQQQVLELLNMARAGHATPAPDLLEPDDTIAAYILMLLLASSSGPVIAQYAGLELEGVSTLFDYALTNVTACPTPADFNRTLDNELRLSFPETPAPSPHQKAPVITPAAQGQGFISAAELLASTGATNPTPPCNTTTIAPPQPDDGDSLTRDAAISRPNMAEQRHVFIGNKFFRAPSLACWHLAVAIHRELQPLANHITMIQRLRLVTTITRSKCINASQALRVNRDIFSATTSVKDMITKLDAEPAKIVGAITGWQRQYFGTLQAKLNTRFKHLAKSLQEPASKHNASRIILPPLPANDRSVPPPPIDTPNSANPPRRKRKRKPRGSKSTDTNSAPPKNDTNGVPATAPLQSTPQRQPRQPRNKRKTQRKTQQEQQPRASSNEPRQPTEDQTSTPADQSTTVAATNATQQRSQRPRKRFRPRPPASAPNA